MIKTLIEIAYKKISNVKCSLLITGLTFATFTPLISVSAVSAFPHDQILAPTLAQNWSFSGCYRTYYQASSQSIKLVFYSDQTFTQTSVSIMRGEPFKFETSGNWYIDGSTLIAEEENGGSKSVFWIISPYQIQSQIDNKIYGRC